MPPRPFPQALSVGTDICHHTRFLKYFPLHQHLASTTTFLSSQTLLFRLFDKAFLPSEQRAFWRKFQDAAPTAYRRLVLGREQRTGIQQWDETRANEAARYLGGRWAAKEAVIKAFSGMRRLMLRDVVIRTEGKGKAPVAIVLDEAGEQETTKSQSAQEVYRQLVKRWELREQLKQLQSEDVGSQLRIIKKASLTRHTAREQEMKKMMPGQQDEQKISPPSSPTAAPTATTTTTSPTPPILSKNGILDLSAITQILEHHQNTSTSSTPNPPQTPTPEPNDAKPEPTDAEDTKDPQQTRLEEEICRLRRQEQQQDAFNNLQGQVVKVSISHDGEYCVATALAAV